MSDFELSQLRKEIKSVSAAIKQRYQQHCDQCWRYVKTEDVQLLVTFQDKWDALQDGQVIEDVMTSDELARVKLLDRILTPFFDDISSDPAKLEAELYPELAAEREAKKREDDERARAFHEREAAGGKTWAAAWLQARGWDVPEPAARPEPPTPQPSRANELQAAMSGDHDAAQRLQDAGYDFWHGGQQQPQPPAPAPTTNGGPVRVVFTGHLAGGSFVVPCADGVSRPVYHDVPIEITAETYERLLTSHPKGWWIRQ